MFEEWAIVSDNVTCSGKNSFQIPDIEYETLVVNNLEKTIKIKKSLSDCERCFEFISECSSISSYISRYGITRSVMELIDRDGNFSSHLNLNSLSPESTFEPNDPSSSCSITAIEGLSETASKAWEYIKKTISKILDTIKEKLDIVKNIVLKKEMNLNELLKALKSAEWDQKKIDEKVFTLVSSKEIVEKYKGISQYITPGNRFINELMANIINLSLPEKSEWIDKAHNRLNIDRKFKTTNGAINVLWPEKERNNIHRDIKKYLSEMNNCMVLYTELYKGWKSCINELSKTNNDEHKELFRTAIARYKQKMNFVDDYWKYIEESINVYIAAIAAWLKCAK